MRLVVIESPFRDRGDLELRRRNIRYLRACLHDSLCRGEAPFASHGLYTQAGVLNDEAPEQRDHGIEAGLAWGDRGEARVCYVDLGVTDGMALGLARAKQIGQPIEYRVVPGWGET